MTRFTTPLVLGLVLVSGCTIKSSETDDSAGGVPARDGSAGERSVGGSAGEPAGRSSAGERSVGGSAGRPAGNSAGATLAGSGGAEPGGAAGAVSITGSAGAAGAEPKSLLDSAHDELAAGATEVTLDKDTVLKLTMDHGKLAFLEVTVSGARAMVIEYGIEGTSVAIDENMDGYVEYLRTLTGTSEDDLVTVQETTKDGATPLRATITRNGSVDDLHIVEETGTADGTWELSDEMDVTQREAYDAAITVDGGSGACTPDQQKILEQAAKSAISKGAECLKKRGLSGLAASLQAVAAFNGFNIVCKKMSELAYADSSGWEANQLSDGSHQDQAQIEMNPTCVAAAGTAAPCAKTSSTEGLLFHEMLHFLQGSHSLWFLLGATPERAEKDLVYSCQFACFDTNLLTKCSCAVCSADYTPCSSECSSKAQCRTKEDGYCHFHCPCNDTDYDTAGECNGGCDVSLACFAGICAAAP